MVDYLCLFPLSGEKTRSLAFKPFKFYEPTFMPLLLPCFFLSYLILLSLFDSFFVFHSFHNLLFNCLFLLFCLSFIFTHVIVFYWFDGDDREINLQSWRNINQKRAKHDLLVLICQSSSCFSPFSWPLYTCTRLLISLLLISRRFPRFITIRLPRGLHLSCSLLPFKFQDIQTITELSKVMTSFYIGNIRQKLTF